MTGNWHERREDQATFDIRLLVISKNRQGNAVMANKLVPGQTAPLIVGQGLQQDDVRVPDSSGRLRTCSFGVLAGCPVCNVHLQSFVRKYDELVQASIREVVVFHSSCEQFKPYQSHYPFEVICDPEKRLYREFGVESSISAIFSWATWKAALKGMLLPGQPKFVPPSCRRTAGVARGFFSLRRDGKIIDSPLWPARLRPVVGRRGAGTGLVRERLARAIWLMLADCSITVSFESRWSRNTILKAQFVAVWVFQVELLHTVEGDLRRSEF